MDIDTAVCVVVIFLFSICVSFYVGYQTGYLRCASLYDEALETLTEWANKQIADKEETPQLRCKTSRDTEL